ncbi:MAG: UDP-glucose 6-dehydrogenase [Planctomycetaceae bacterium]|nr:MAG: UDP-glucose 6-dehydrogenase [Planctomycetaceae bacterium]
MRMVMIGTGYVGLVTGACLADSGHQVTCVDIDGEKIDRLNRGELPIYEPGLHEIVLHNKKAGRLHFTTDLQGCVPEARLIFLAVGTPQSEQGHADLTALWEAIESLAPLLQPRAIVVVKSTVPVGTNRQVARRLQEITGRHVDVCSNPEFLKEGCAIEDFTKPDRVVVGVERPEVAQLMHEIYKPFLRTERPFLVMNWESAEMTKYVANCMLATKISFINEMANLCEAVGADINAVRRGIGHDQRIGFQFLFPGCGYGGSCFPKDVRALMATAEAAQVPVRLLQSVDEVNRRQKHILFQKICRVLGHNLSGVRIAVWGLSFKPRTDDIREAPALVLLQELLTAKATVRVHDPAAMDHVRKLYGDQLIYCAHHYDTLDAADALAICTEWQEYRNPDFDYMKYKMRRPFIFDGRNLWEPETMLHHGFVYYGIGLKPPDTAPPVTAGSIHSC